MTAAEKRSRFRLSPSRLPVMANLFQIAIPVALFAVLATLCVGIYALFRGGDFGRSYSNRLMRLRVVLQFVAVLVLVAAFWWSHR